MATYRTSTPNQLRTPSGAVGEPPDLPGGMATFADDVETRFGYNGFERVATIALRDAIPTGRKFTGKRVRVDADGITYGWSGTVWAPVSSTPQNFAPTFTNLTLGNGSAAGSSWWEAGVQHGRISVTWGSTSAGTSGLLFNLPDNRYTADTTYPLVGDAYLKKAAGALTPLTPVLDTAYRFGLWAAGASGPMTASSVSALAAGDLLVANFDVKMS